MALSYIEKTPITIRLSQAIRKMRDFLLSNSSVSDSSNGNYYKILRDKINKLIIGARTEGYFGFEYNPYTTLADFLSQNNTKELIVKYYSIYGWKREFIKSSKIKKDMRCVKNSIEWITDIAVKFFKISLIFFGLLFC